MRRFPIERLLEPLPELSPERSLDSADPRLEAASAAAIRGEYLVAAQIAETLYADGILDARLIGYLLFGTLCDRGPASSPLLLQASLKVVSDHRAAFGPKTRRDILLDGAMGWFFGKWVAQIERADQRHDALWGEWLRAAEQGVLSSVPEAIASLQPHLLALSTKPRAPFHLVRLSELFWALLSPREKRTEPASAESGNGLRFSSAETLLSKAGPPPDPPSGTDPAPDSTEDAISSESIPTPHPQHEEPPGDLEQTRPPEPEEPTESPAAVASTPLGPQSPPQPRLPVVSDLDPPNPPVTLPAGFVAPGAILATSKLIALAETIERFVDAAEQRQYLHAAVLAHEIQTELDHFDPRLYLGAVLTPFFRTLLQCGERLQPILDQKPLVFRTLAQLYRADPSAFLLGTDDPAPPSAPDRDRRRAYPSHMEDDD